MTRDRRRERDQPYLEEHIASARPRPPRTFGELLNWFLEGFRAETPERMHVHEVWRTTRRLDSAGRPTEAVPSAEQGGSQLGSPRYAEPFRQLLENSDRQWTDEAGTVDPYYVRPMRAALARMAGHADDGQSAFMARFLLQVAFAGGDWQSVADRWALVPFAGAPSRAIGDHQRHWTETALRRLHRCWRPDPPIAGLTWVDRSDAQRTAEAQSDGSAA